MYQWIGSDDQCTTITEKSLQLISNGQKYVFSMNDVLVIHTKRSVDDPDTKHFCIVNQLFGDLMFEVDFQTASQIESMGIRSIDPIAFLKIVEISRRKK